MLLTSNVHPLKAAIPIESWMLLANNINPLKASIPIEFMDVGRFMLESDSERVIPPPSSATLIIVTIATIYRRMFDTVSLVVSHSSCKSWNFLNIGSTRSRTIVSDYWENPFAFLDLRWWHLWDLIELVKIYCPVIKYFARNVFGGFRGWRLRFFVWRWCFSIRLCLPVTDV